MNRLAVMVVVLLSLVAQRAAGDCGGIPFKPSVTLYEPTQRAVIAFDSGEEILLLAADLRASEPTKVLQAIPEPMKEVVGEYLQDRYKWFVFDVIEVGPEVKSKEAIQYRFATDKLYYPLRITRSEEGDTDVRLLVLSPKLVRVPKLGDVRVRLAHEPIRISGDELRFLGSDDMTALLQGRSCLLRTWEVTGPLAGFKKDILTTGP